MLCTRATDLCTDISQFQVGSSYKESSSSVPSNHSFSLDLRTELIFPQFPAITVLVPIFAQRFFFLSSQQSQFQVPATEPFFVTGADPSFNAQERTNKTLTIDPFGNTYKEDEVSPEVEAGMVVGLLCLQP
jgi:hypothetical protein